jgi:Holliday junction resolvase RusA-like endonuclease
MTHYTIPGTPITKKNSQRIFRNPKTGKPFITRSAAYEDFEAAASYYLQPKPPNPIDSQVAVRCLYYMPTRRRVDLTNLMEATHDILVHCGILADDNCRIVASVDGSRVLYDKDKPRTEIFITEMEEDAT